MLEKLIRNIKLLNSQNNIPNSEEDPSQYNQPLSTDYNANLSAIKNIFLDCGDIVIREFKIGVNQQVATFIVLIDKLSDKRALSENILKPLMAASSDINICNAFSFVKESIVSIAEIKETKNLGNAVSAILSGSSVLFIDGSDTALISSIQAWEGRAVDEPDTEAVVRGPREGFVETLRINVSLIRRKMKNPNLKFQTMTVGKQTKTELCIAYIQGIVNENILQEVKSRIERINIDAVLESGYIEAFIEDAPFSIFPTIGNSEKPDIIIGKLLEGRVAVLVDGTPFVLTAPYLFIEAFQSSEDYYSRPFYASIVRSFRWLAFFLSVYLPAVYVALVTFHQALLPSALIISIASALEGVPFPAVVEAILMQVIYEILREGGVRLPRPIGQAVSIVGALVIGEAAVSAGLIGAPMVIVVALTAISSFVVPPLSDVNFICRIFFLLLSGFSGLYGIVLGTAFVLTHICSLRSFGIYYTSPMAPLTLADMKDVFVRVPLWAMITRPKTLKGKDSIRQDNNIPNTPKNKK